MDVERNNQIADTFKSFGKQLLGFIKKRVSNTEDAEDIFQEVFYQFTGSAAPVEQVSNWLFTVARNKITDGYRKKKWPLADDLFFEEEMNDDLYDWREFLLADHRNPETEYLRSLFWEELQNALNELPQEQREVFIQNEIEDVSFKEIEAQTGISVATLISRKRYAG